MLEILIACAASPDARVARHEVSADQALLQDAIDGTVGAEDALAAIAASGGMPVETADSAYLFACTCGDGDWSVAGDHDAWAGTAMTRAGDLSWAEIAIEEPDGSRYKFTDGATWESDPWGRRFAYDDFGAVSYVRASDAHLERWYAMGGGRNIDVWVPDGGDFDRVLYAHDGQNLFDPEAPWGGWKLDQSLPDGVLVAAIPNTSDRIDEYTHTPDVIDGQEMGGGADAYADYVDGVVRPFVETAYGAPTLRGTLGSSLGGLVAFHLVRRHDGYDMAISLSGTMGWGSIGAHNPTMIELYDTHGDAALYLDSGGGGTCWDADGDGIEDDDPDASDNYCENAQFRDRLATLGYEYDVDLWHWWEPGATHDEAAWAARVGRPLEIFAAM